MKLKDFFTKWFFLAITLILLGVICSFHVADIKTNSPNLFYF